MVVTRGDTGVIVTATETETETATVTATETIMIIIETKSLKTQPPSCQACPPVFPYPLGQLH